MAIPASSSVIPGSVSQVSPNHEALSMATFADAPIQISTGSGGNGLIAASWKHHLPSMLTVSPFQSALRVSMDCSNAEGRYLIFLPMPLNCLSPAPNPHCRINRLLVIQARVATCSATSTGFQSGSRNNTPAGRSPHSASKRPIIGVFW